MVGQKQVKRLIAKNQRKELAGRLFLSAGNNAPMATLNNRFKLMNRQNGQKDTEATEIWVTDGSQLNSMFGGRFNRLTATLIRRIRAKFLAQIIGGRNGWYFRS